MFLVSGLLFTVLELPVLCAALGVGEVGDSLLSSVLPVSELPDPELTPLKQKNISVKYQIFFLRSKHFLVPPLCLTYLKQTVEFHPFYGYLRLDNAFGCLREIYNFMNVI